MTVPRPSNVIVWFRRDLRIADNAALGAALEYARRTGGTLLPLFVLDSALVGPSGPNRLAFLYRCLRGLRSNGVPICVRAGDPVREVTEIALATASAVVFATADFAPYGSQRDRAVERALRSPGCELQLVDSPYVVAPGEVRKGDGTPFKVFTPFSRAWRDHAVGRAASPTADLDAVRWTDVAETAIPRDPAGTATDLLHAGEAHAHLRLGRFIADHLRTYDSKRNDPAADATSRLSADLKFGVLHPRQILPLLDGHGRGADVFRNELCWREFYADVLWHHPASARAALNPQMESMRVDEGPVADAAFAAWCAGRTGYPFIDAGMRQLLREGWMHNRVRMAAASFLVKDLHLDWRRGARWFMHHLVDGDLASNQHGWQWTAGTGTDAAPYFRVFNPVLQGMKFDPDGVYVRRYVEELAHVPKRLIHEPWLAGNDALFPDSGDSGDSGDSADTVDSAHSGSSTVYPHRLVDHGAERDEALRRYREIRP